MLNNAELKIRIIKFIYDFSSSDYIKRVIIYNKINIYYY